MGGGDPWWACQSQRLWPLHDLCMFSVRDRNTDVLSSPSDPSALSSSNDVFLENHRCRNVGDRSSAGCWWTSLPPEQSLFEKNHSSYELRSDSFSITEHLFQIFYHQMINQRFLISFSYGCVVNLGNFDIIFMVCVYMCYIFFEITWLYVKITWKILSH